MRKSKKTLAILAIIAMVLMMIPVQAFADTTSATNRLADVDRVGTAIAIANNGWTTASTVIVAPADDANLVDALAVAPLAGQDNAPILMTYKDGLDAKVAAEIATLKATNVIAVGALSDATVAQLKAISGVTVNQVKGADRFETAAKIAAMLTNPAGTFVVAYNGLADALSAASFAAANKYAIMIADTNGSLPASETVVGSKTYTVGGQVAAVTGATPFAGADRYATNDAVLKGLTYKYDKVYVANGETLVDALAGSALAAKTQSPIILANTTGATAAAGVNAKLSASSQVIAFGGAAVVPDAVLGSVKYTTPVFGAPAAVSVSAINPILANGKSTQTFTASVVDANGVTVSNFVGFIKVGFKNNTYNGAVNLTDPASGNAVTTNGSTVETYRVTNGVATIKLSATATPYVTDTLSFTANYTQPDGVVVTFPVQYATVSSTSQQAVSIKVTGPATISNNVATTVPVKVQVLDADGKAVTSGTYSVLFHITGDAYWSDKTTDDKTIGTIQSGTDGAVATAYVMSKQGVGGSVSVTATVSGLPTATYTAPIVTAQSPKAVTLSTPTQSGQIGGDRVKYTLNLVDANGNLTTYGSNLTFNLKNQNDTDDLSYYLVSTGGSALGSGSNDASITLPASTSSISFYVTSGTVGSVNFNVIDQTGNYTSAAGSVSFTGGAYDHISIYPLNKNNAGTRIGTTIAASNPTQTITIKAKDAGGNTIPASQYVAIAVKDADATANTGTAKINGQAVSESAPIILSTDANGVITATLSVGGYLGDNWVVEAQTVATPTSIPASGSWTGATPSYVYTGVFTVGYTAASQLSVSLSTNSVNSGATSTATVTVQDANQVNVTGDALRVTTNDKKMTITGATLNTAKSDAATNVYDVTAGTYTFGVVGGKAGTQTFVVTDLTSPLAPSVTQSIVVNAASSGSKIIVLTPNGDQNAYGIASGTTIAGPFTLQLSDSNGNPVVASQDIFVTPSQIDSLMTGGTNNVAAFAGIRTTSTGANVSTLKIAAGTSSASFYAEVTTTGQMVPTATASALSYPLVVAPTITAASKHGGASVTITAPGAGYTSWLAPANTVAFSAGATMTTAAGAATTILAPANEGTYYLYTVDANGNISPASTNAITVDNTAPVAPVLAKLTVTDNTTPAVDTVAGIAGAVEAGATVKVYSDAALTTQVGTATAAADGSFAAINLADNHTGAVSYYVVAVDAAGNVSASTTISDPGAN